MAEARRDLGGRRRRWEWRRSGLTALLLAAVIGNFHTVFDASGWWISVVFLIVVVLGVSTSLRVIPRLQRLRFLPPLAGALAGVLVTVLWFFPGRFFSVLVEGTIVSRGTALFAEGVESLQQQATPAVVVPGILFVLCCAVVVLAVLCDVIANVLRAPAATALPLLPLAVTPAFVAGTGVDLFWMCASALAFLATLAPIGGRGLRSGAVAIAAVCMAAAIVVPTLLPLNASVGGGGSGAGSIANGANPIVTLGEDLRRSDDGEVLRYSTESGRARYLRLVVLSTFSDDGWRRSEAETASGADAPPPVGSDGEVPTVADTVAIEVATLGGSWLPSPYPPVSVSGLRNDASWDVETLALRSASRSIRGEQYEIVAAVPELSPELLADAGDVVPESVERFAVADPAWPAVIAETASAVTAGASSNYERAVALQRYFRSSEFAYSEDTPVDEGYDGTDAGVIAEFLAAKSGYCVHYASSMAVMARTLGIPSRVVVGFLPGEESDDEDDAGRSLWRVSARQLHAWPELFFDGVGWVAFEPTSSRGVVPSYSRGVTGASADPSTPSVAPSQAASTPSASAPGAAPDREDFGSVDVAEEGSAGGWVLAVLVLLTVALLAPAILRWFLRRRRLGALGAVAPLTQWREVLATAEDLGIGVSDLLTPRGNLAVLRHRLGTLEHTDDVEASLQLLVSAVEHDSYGRGGPAAQLSVAQLASVLRALRGSVPRGIRLRAAVLPRSLLSDARVRRAG